MNANLGELFKLRELVYNEKRAAAEDRELRLGSSKYLMRTQMVTFLPFQFV